MFDVEAFILVGGQSRRMGRDKAQIVLAGQTILGRIAGELSGVAASVAVVGAREEYSNYLSVPDIHEHWGALGGIHASLKAANTDWAIVAACDLPFISKPLFQFLLTFINKELDAIVPVQRDGRPQPVCALYRAATCLPEIERQISLGEHTPRALLHNVRTHYVQFDELAHLPGAEHFFLNVNTPEDLRAARAILE